MPLAIVSLCGFVLGGVFAIGYLRTGRREWDMRSYVAIHMALIFSIGGLVTGSIWAKASWGHWWVWQEPTLVSYLIVILLFATYQPLRFSIEDPERQSRYAAVFAIVGGAFVPLNFIAVRLSVQYVHPRILNLEGGALPGPMKLTFYVCLLGIALAVRDADEVRDGGQGPADPDPPPAPRARRRGLPATVGPERGSERLTMFLPLAQAPALPLHKAGPYVAAAYIVFLAVVLVYVLIMGVRLSRNQRELAQLRREVEARELSATSQGDARDSTDPESLGLPRR